MLGRRPAQFVIDLANKIQMPATLAHLYDMVDHPSLADKPFVVVLNKMCAALPCPAPLPPRPRSRAHAVIFRTACAATRWSTCCDSRT